MAPGVRRRPTSRAGQALSDELLAPGATSLFTALYVGLGWRLLARVSSSLKAGMLVLPRRMMAPA